MTVFLLAIFSTMAVTMRRNRDRWFAGCALALGCGLHYVAFSRLDGFMFCFTGCLCDILVIGVIASYIKTTRLSDAIVKICVVSFFANIYGWILYVNELSVEPYNATITALYLIAIFSLLSKERAHDFGISNQDTGLRFLVCKLGHLCASLCKKAAT